MEGHDQPQVDLRGVYRMHRHNSERTQRRLASVPVDRRTGEHRLLEAHTLEQALVLDGGDEPIRVSDEIRAELERLGPEGRAQARARMTGRR